MTMPDNTADLWVFGYGSLMWRPGFAFEECRPALLPGWHRSLCIYSWHYRGTRERPGLVLGLDRGGSCRGLAFRVAAAEADAVRAYLREREMQGCVYREIVRPVRLAQGRRVAATAYVADTAHAQYAGGLALARQVALVRQGSGVMGPNRDYVLNTLAHLRELGVRDPKLTAVADGL